MKERNNFRRGFALAIAGVTGLSAAALGVVGISEHADLTAQRDVALVNAADDAHNDLIAAQVQQNDSLFNNDVALQQSIYYWATEAATHGGLGLDSKLLFPGNPDDPENSIFNGAFSRFNEAQLVSQALQQAQLDHMLGVNQTLGAGGYETQIADSIYGNLSGAGIPETGALHDALAAIAPGSEVFDSASGFQGALSDLENALMQSAWADLFGMFSVGDMTP